jgi:hypothetical protein
MRIIGTYECEVCGGGGFESAGTGYNNVCSECGGIGKHPIFEDEEEDS